MVPPGVVCDPGSEAADTSAAAPAPEVTPSCAPASGQAFVFSPTPAPGPESLFGTDLAQESVLTTVGSGAPGAAFDKMPEATDPSTSAPVPETMPSFIRASAPDLASAFLPKPGPGFEPGPGSGSAPEAVSEPRPISGPDATQAPEAAPDSDPVCSNEAEQVLDPADPPGIQPEAESVSEAPPFVFPTLAPLPALEPSHALGPAQSFHTPPQLTRDIEFFNSASKDIIQALIAENSTLKKESKADRLRLAELESEMAELLVCLGEESAKCEALQDVVDKREQGGPERGHNPEGLAFEI